MIIAYIKYLLAIIVMLLCFACSSDKEELKKTPFFEADTAFKEADEMTKKGYYEKAREILQSIKAQDTTGKNTPLAQIRIGDTYFEDESYDEAVIEYENFLDEHPHHKYAPYAQYRLALCYFKRIETPDVSYSMAKQALKEFEKLLNIYPRNPYVNAVESKIKTCQSMLAEYELYVGKFYFKKESYSAAVNRFNSMLQNYPDSKKEPEALYYLGLSYKYMGETDKAINTLKTLIEKYPAIKLSNEAKEVIASLETK